MIDRRPLVSGDVIVDRYVLHDQVSESLGVRNWRAVDRQLHRNVRVELLNADDPRAENFLGAARRSTVVTDHRFLPVLDLIENDQGFHAIVREWARATDLNNLLAQAPLSNVRAADLVAEVAEAIGHAHLEGVHHRRLTPHQVLLKQSGAVRIVGLGVATALAPPQHQDSAADLARYVALDVQGIGKLLYACLVGRWPGGHVDGLRAAPTEHGHLLRPRRVRAGIHRTLDDLCDRILAPERHPRRAARDPLEIARELREFAELDEATEEHPRVDETASTDLLRMDPVIVPAGPPPGLEPPRRLPKAMRPKPPTRMDVSREHVKSALHGHRALLTLGLVVVAALTILIGYLVGREAPVPKEQTDPNTPVTVLKISDAKDFDPQGGDGSENPQQTGQAIDGDLETGWRTSTYYGSAELGGLKDGVGLVLDLGSAHEVQQVRVRFRDSPTDFSVMVAPATEGNMPRDVSKFREAATLNSAGHDTAVALSHDTFSRYVLIWLRSLPEVDDGEYRAEITDVIIRGR